jgi:hypothetical protein
VVQLSLLQVMMVFCLFSFGKQVLPLFFVRYIDYQIHLACSVHCWPSLLSNKVAVHIQVSNIMTYNVLDIHGRLETGTVI